MSTLGTLLQHLPVGSEFGKTKLGQVNWEGDGSSVHISLLNDFPFLCHTWQQVIERGGHADSLSGAASVVRCTGGQSFRLW